MVSPTVPDIDEEEGVKFRSLKEIYETTQPLPPTQGGPFEYSSEHGVSSLARKSISRQGSQIDGINNYDELSVDALIKNTSMQESQQSQTENPRNVSNPMDDWVRVCDTCGDRGYESLLVYCNMCPDGAAHTYCMRVMPFEKPNCWTCEECAPMVGTGKLMQDKVKAATVRTSKGHLSKLSINLESSKGAEKRTIGVSSTDQEKEKVSPACGDRKGKRIITLAQLEEKRQDLDTRMVSCKESNTDNHSPLGMELPSKKMEKAKLGVASNVIPSMNHSWLGKFLIHNSEGIEKTCDGFQAHLSSCASLKVHEVVGKLPEIIILEELPRLGIWPSQFMRSQVNEENIALYFFANDVNSYDTYYRGLVNHMTNNDLALKGNLDGVELLIFPSNILPEKAQRWNQMLFLWGVFKAQRVNNSANTRVSNFLKQGNGDTVKKRVELNAYPEDEDEDDDDDDTGGDETKPLDASHGFADEGGVNLAVQGRSITLENSSVGIEHHAKEPPTSLSLASLSIEEYTAETLIHLSRDKWF